VGDIAGFPIGDQVAPSARLDVQGSQDALSLGWPNDRASTVLSASKRGERAIFGQDAPECRGNHERACIAFGQVDHQADLGGRVALEEQGLLLSGVVARATILRTGGLVVGVARADSPGFVFHGGPHSEPRHVRRMPACRATRVARTIPTFTMRFDFAALRNNAPAAPSLGAGPKMR